ncbi:hypothetical protein OBBRIDRAFT_721352 [Obba rivulosa]|uniref:Uncharacterized protein n=1 Tax=Obba rivulosa TaxID=1052685 RepID=A0A8E2DT26_9APHY|nr:hypothetical protein OBBRIDRAFT_721352 [Obba rivulosa]
MQILARIGPSEVLITGTLKDWSIVDILASISAPTLLINGRFDEAQNVGVLPFFLHIPKVRCVQFVDSSHMTFHEERESYIDVVERSLKEM